MIAEWLKRKLRRQDRKLFKTFQYLWRRGMLDAELMKRLKSWSLKITKKWGLPEDQWEDISQDLLLILSRCKFRGRCRLQTFVMLIGDRLVNRRWKKNGANAVVDFETDDLQRLAEGLEDGKAAAYLEVALRRISSKRFVERLRLECTDLQCEILAEIELSQLNYISRREITRGLKKRRPELKATRYKVDVEYERILHTVRRITGPRNDTC